MKKVLIIVGVLCVFIQLVGMTEADVISTRVRTTDINISSADPCPGAGCPFLPFSNSATSTTLPFVTTEDNQRVVIVYNSECTVGATGTVTWVSLTIFVDGVVATPSGTDKAHCTSDNGGSNWVSAVATAVVVVPEPGIHGVRIQANLNSVPAGGATTRLDDTTIIVMK